MILSVASGKGGTGKTTFSTNFAWYLQNVKGISTSYLDCDVEEPNGHLFLKPAITEKFDTGIKIPVIDNDACIECGLCYENCYFHALAGIKGKGVLVFEDLCHGCGLCARICPVSAITEKDNIIGVVEKGEASGIEFVHGRLFTGNSIAVPVIKDVKKHITDKNKEREKVYIVDAPPGTSCTMVHAINGSDFTILVTEPTPFGLHDLQLAVKTVQNMNIPFGIVINRMKPDRTIIHEYCAREEIIVLGEIPESSEIAKLYSVGELPVKKLGFLNRIFDEIFQKVDQILRKQ